jgi:N-acetylglucosamine-6-phosphate deacetylase
MTASVAELSRLAEKLGRDGVAGFCATTLSAPRPELKAVVEKLGHWIHSCEKSKTSSALPLGIHLEGPFIGPAACGAHPPSAIRPLDLTELEDLWQASLQTIKIITVATEAIKTAEEGKQLIQFCKKRKILLSLGHTSCTEREAQKAFDNGFMGVTHAWNALQFHHRTPGAMGAALGRRGVYVELILDQIHVSPTVIRWTLELHQKKGQVCFVSDAAPAAETSGQAFCSFGPLKIRYQMGASRLENGHLAGGGLLLSHAYARWLETELRLSSPSERDKSLFLQKLLKKTLRHLTLDPLKVLQVPRRLLKGHDVVWKIKDNRVSFD